MNLRLSYRKPAEAGAGPPEPPKVKEEKVSRRCRCRRCPWRLVATAAALRDGPCPLGSAPYRHQRCCSLVPLLVAAASQAGRGPRRVDEGELPQREKKKCFGAARAQSRKGSSGCCGGGAAGAPSQGHPRWRQTAAGVKGEELKGVQVKGRPERVSAVVRLGLPWCRPCA